MITKRDMEIVEFMLEFGGKTFSGVLEKTFFCSCWSMRQRVSTLCKQGTLKRKKTGFLQPKYYFVLGDDGREWYLEKHGREAPEGRFSQFNYYHAVLEQIAFYWVSRLRECVRTTTYKNQMDLLPRKLRHIPDFYFVADGGKIINVEAEITKKAQDRYKSIIDQSIKDGASAILYITESKKECQSLARTMPRWSGLFFVAIDDLIKGIKEGQEIRSSKQSELLGDGIAENDEKNGLFATE